MNCKVLFWELGLINVSFNAIFGHRSIGGWGGGVELRNRTLLHSSSALFTSVMCVHASVRLCLNVLGPRSCNHLHYRIHRVHFDDFVLVVQFLPELHVAI